MVYEDRGESSLEKKAKKTAGKVYTKADIDASILQSIKYEYPNRRVWVELGSDEFTCLCPYSGLPDFARLTIRYIPHRRLIELKSLKYYLYSFRNVKIYNEHVVNKILEDLTKTLKPHEIEIVGEFTSRGGIKNKVIAQSKTRKQQKP